MFGILLYDILFWGIPAVLLVFFGISLYRYRSAVAANKETPNTFSPEEIKLRKTVMIIAAVVAGALAVAVLALVALLFMAVAFM